MEDPARPEMVRLRYMAAEPGEKSGKLLEGWEYAATEAMLDGPVTRRLAIIDIDPKTGAVGPGAPFVPRQGRTMASYAVADETDPFAADFQAVSTFGAVMAVMDMFEEPDVLGRKLRWGFAGEQLLVVPRAGQMANAFYHRDSRSLQFFFFDTDGGRIHTCLSPDIVAHETTHAILDGIAPDLYDASHPQSLALHEAVADLAAVLFSLRGQWLPRRVLETSQGDLSGENPFNAIARQFGEAIYQNGRPLRDLNRKARLPDLAHASPHELSEVISGAFYRMFVALHDRMKDKLVAERDPAKIDKTLGRPKTEEEARYSASGKAMWLAGGILKRMALRGLDYLPPGEITFADYARAVMAADLSSNPGNPEPRDILLRELVDRAIVSGAPDAMPVPPDVVLPPETDLDLVITSDWAAYRFAEAHRDLLRIPRDTAYEVRPRLDTTKETWRSEGMATTHEMIFKVAWRVNHVLEGREFAQTVSVMHGTTMVIDRRTGALCALLTTAPDDPLQSEAAPANDLLRGAFIAACIADGAVEPGSPNAAVQDGVLRLRGTGQLLHMSDHHMPEAP